MLQRSGRMPTPDRAPSLRTRWGSRAVATLLCLGALASPTRAVADDALRMNADWGKLAGVIRHAGTSLRSNAALPIEPDPHASAAAVPEDRPWVGGTPHLSLVARDWGGAQLLAGRLLVTDLARLSRSSRMVVTRVRLTEGRIAPFAQVGLGQWRIDTDLLPALPRDVELAGQLGGGFELPLTRAATLALEADYTVLYREQHEPQMVCSPHVWGALLAARAFF